jgi:AraC-like DNA-binding protein
MSAESVSLKGYLYEDFRLFHNNDISGVQVDMHYHTFHKVTLVVQGTGSYMIDGRLYDILPGDIIFIGMNVPHMPSFEKGKIYERYTLYISQTMLENLQTDDCDLSGLFYDPDMHVLRLPSGVPERLQRNAGMIETELKGNAFGSTLLSRMGVCSILVEAGRCRENSAGIPALRLNDNDKMLSLLRYINAHIDEELSINSLSERFFLSRYHLMRLFKASFKMTIHEYITERRLIKARQMMINGVLPAEACYSCGFGSYSSFGRAYRKKYGISPGKTVKTNRPEEGIREFFPE